MIILIQICLWSDHFRFRNVSDQNSSLIRLSGFQKILNTTILAVTNFLASVKNSHFMSDARMCAQQSLIKYGLGVLSVGSNAFSYKKISENRLLLIDTHCCDLFSKFDES